MQAALLIVVAILTVAAWLLTYSTYQQMGLLMQIGVPMSLEMAGSAGIVSFTAFVGMWLVMMVAMMLPSSYPTLRLHRTVYCKRNPNVSGGTFLFALGYFLVWTASGAFFYLGYVLIGSMRSHIPGSEVSVLRAAGFALILAGIYQCSWFKRACLTHCQNPLHFVMEHWYDGNLGSLRMGAMHGLYCFGCCWGLMVILFVMGIMHLGWMAAIGALILIEKVLPSAKWIPNAIGALFLVVGGVVMLFPETLSRLSSQVALF